MMENVPVDAAAEMKKLIKKIVRIRTLRYYYYQYCYMGRQLRHYISRYNHPPKIFNSIHVASKLMHVLCFGVKLIA